MFNQKLSINNNIFFRHYELVIPIHPIVRNKVKFTINAEFL